MEANPVHCDEREKKKKNQTIPYPLHQTPPTNGPNAPKTVAPTGISSIHHTQMVPMAGARFITA